MSSDSAADPSEMTSRSDRFNNHYTPHSTLASDIWGSLTQQVTHRKRSDRPIVHRAGRA